ncbi:branched-chain amino acid ABC transporter permease [Roseiarcaceae bacterium H3SJ34-1]|uniref:branched-chain amino acid ABC transporter permease n=1 Tax=Terripilifer ovatus TaxID=3032367 RepID=UPI003AB9A4E7|nr:branched-chain amino acid ABC transporter permease [Roseiarcaceae bacterium H3SJ34-1]
MSIDILVQVLLSGLLLGGIYALVAFGLSLVYGVANILNIAHGTLLAISGVVASLIFAATGWNPILIIPLLVLPVFLFGYLFHAALLRPLASRGKHDETIGTVLITVGSLIMMSDITGVVAGTNQQNIPVRSEILEFGDVIVPLTQVWILAGIIGLTIILHLYLKYAWFGRAVRAVTQDPLGATICGVNGPRAKALTFAGGSGLVAIAGVLYAMIYPVDPYMGFSLTVRAFTIIIIGGIGNLAGAMIAGIMLGVAESFTAFLWAPKWAPAISVVLLLIILVLFPRGLALWKRA